MFGIGFTEIILIAVLALVVLGPDKLPQLGKTLARFLGEFNKVKRDFRMTVSDIERAGERATESAPEEKAGQGDVIDVEAKADASGLPDDADDITFEPQPPTPEGSVEAAGVGRKPARSAKPVRSARPARPRRRNTVAKKPRPVTAKPNPDLKPKTETIKKTTTRKPSQRRAPRKRAAAKAAPKPQNNSETIAEPNEGAEPSPSINKGEA